MSLPLQIGSEVMVAVKAKMVAASNSEALIEQINYVESAFKAGFTQVMWLFLEPGIDD